MKAVILAGGLGTRISEETHLKPKPMIEIGERPILWHIMKLYSYHGINEFIICVGYKGYLIKEYFANYYMHMSDVTFDMHDGHRTIHTNDAEPWTVTVVDTGEKTQTGGRLKRVAKYIGGETFCMTYGDGVSDINIGKLLDFHNSHGKMATLTAVQPPGRFGRLGLNGDQVGDFLEKPSGEGGWISGGFFVLHPNVIDYIDDDMTVWERTPLEKIAADGELMAYKHTGFWQPMDTLRDKALLENLWENAKAPWRLW
ncbi:glucose-1-phosphate cytidylyltransferase [Synergistaceae bacterium OttesenSCG-928-I11]|nr:glucose-1-phosphate cytidylyltransferase [Synergistaceae bacterium OttesenSCG-928-I11]